jgi:hypothetical protein
MAERDRSLEREAEPIYLLSVARVPAPESMVVEPILTEKRWHEFLLATAAQLLGSARKRRSTCSGCFQGGPPFSTTPSLVLVLTFTSIALLTAPPLHAQPPRPSIAAPTAWAAPQTDAGDDEVVAMAG